ncbi:MAG: translocation/assembly module TamB domain-containing protein [Candidatus Brocadiae bacterium]|nr:translocation/assembly module TamB domain-containing protein [Candidatus Brocadiia bacterium]
MKAFFILLSPAIWLLKIFWKIFKKCWILGLVLLYLFRIPLFSHHILDFLHEKIKKSGMEISTGKLDGSYLFGFSLHSIKLEKPTAEIKKLEIQKISVSYNIFAPIFGKKILQEIAIYKPDIELSKQDTGDDSQAKEGNVWERLKSIADIDIFLLISNSPSLLLQDTNLAWESPKQKIALQGFTWKSRPNKGSIGFSKIETDSLETKQKKAISDFSFEWSLQDKKVMVEKASVRIQGYPYPLSIPKPILLDLGTQRINLGKFYIPLPEDGLLEGNISYEDGCYIHLNRLQLGLPEILPIANLLTNQKIDSIPVYMTLHLSMDFPNWDLNRLRGTLLLLMSENSRLGKDIKLDLPEKPEIQLRTEIENLEIIEKILSCFFPQREKNSLSGKWINQSQIRIDQDTIFYTGEVHSPDLRALYLQERELSSNWKVALDKKSQKIHLEEWNLQFLPLIAKIKADITREKDTQASLNAKLSGESLSSLLPKKFRDLIETSLTSEWKFAFRSSSLHPTLENSSLSGECQINLSQLKVLSYCFKDITIQSQFSLQKDKIQIKKLQIEWEKKKLFHFQGEAAISGEFQGEAEISLSQIQEYAKKYFPQISPFPQGDVLLKASFHGALPLSKNPWQIQSKIQAEWQKAKYKDFVLGNLVFLAQAAASPEKVLVPSWEFLRNRVSLGKGKARYFPQGISQLLCHLSLPGFHNTLSAFMPQEQIPVQGDFFSKIDLKGNLQEILAGTGWLQSRIHSTLQKAKYKNFEIPDLDCQIIGKANQKQAWISQAVFRGKNFSLHSSAKIGYDESLLSEIQAKFEAKDFMNLLPQNLPFQASMLKTHFSASGKIPWSKIDQIGKGNTPWAISSGFSLSLLQGKIHNFPYQELSCQGNLHAVETSARWEKLVLKWDDRTVLQSEGKYVFAQQEIYCKTHLGLTGVEKYLPEISKHALAKEITGNFKGLLEFQTKLPKQGNIWSAQGKVGARLEDGQIRNVPYKKIQFLLPIGIDEEKMLISNMRIHWADKEILKASGKIGYKNQIPVECRIESYLTESLKPILATFAPKIKWDFYGQCPLIMDVSGMLSLPEQKCDIKTSLEIPLMPQDTQEEWKWENKSVLVSGRKEKSGIFLKAHCYGNIERPSMEGRLDFYLPKITFLQQDMTVRNLFFHTEIQESKIQMKAGVSLGGSPLDIQGEIALENFQPRQAFLKVQGHRLLLIRNQQMYSRANIDLLLEGIVKEHQKKSQFQGKLSGQIDIAEFDIKIPMSLDKKAQRPPIALGYESDFVQMLLDIKISFPKIVVKNNLLHIETKGDLNIKGDLAKPHIQGYLATDSGKLFLPQGVMEIREYLVRISPEAPLKPNFTLKAATQVRDYRIFVVIQGTPDNFTLEFLSVPPLPKEDILALMLTGGTRSELQQSAGKKMQETGSFILMQQFLNKIGLGAYVSAQITQEVAAITIMPPEWKGFAIQGKVEKASKVGFHFIYRMEFK